MRKHNIKFHSYADETQLYLSFSPTKAEGFHALSCLTKCVSEIELWMKANLLKLNTEKTEILVLDTKSVIRKYHLDDFRVGLSSIGPSETVRNLGSIFDPVLNMACHVTSLCKSAYYHLYNLGKVRKCLTRSMLLLVPDWTMVTLCCMGLILACWISYSAYKILQHCFSQGPRSMNISHQFLPNYTGFQCVAL